MIEPIGWQNYHLKVAHVMMNMEDEDKCRDLQFDLENPDEFRSALREITNFPFPKGMLTECKYISNYNSQHPQTTHCNLLCKNSLKIRKNLLKKPIHLYMSRCLLISRVVVKLNLWTHRRSMKTLRGCNFNYHLFRIETFIQRKNPKNKIKIGALHYYWLNMS